MYQGVCRPVVTAAVAANGAGSKTITELGDILAQSDCDLGDDQACRLELTSRGYHVPDVPDAMLRIRIAATNTRALTYLRRKSMGVVR